MGRRWRRSHPIWSGHGDPAIEKAWSFPWGGEIDEVRISDVARSAGWIATEHNNHISPAASPTFYTVGSQELRGPVCGPSSATSPLTPGGDPVLLNTDLGSLGSVTINLDET